MLVQAEEKWGKTTCWDSVTKLELLAKRASVNGVVQVRKVISMLQGIEFYCDSNFVSSSKLSISELGGKGRLGRGLLDIILFKLDVLDDWLNNKMDTCRLAPNDKARIRKSMEDFPSFVALMNDSSWAAPLNASGKAFAELVEAPCLGHKLHVCGGTLQTSLCFPHDTACSTQHLTVRRTSSATSMTAHWCLSARGPTRLTNFYQSMRTPYRK